MDDTKLLEMENQIVLLRHSFGVLKESALLDGVIDDEEAARIEELELKIAEAERLCDKHRSELMANSAVGDGAASDQEAEDQTAPAEAPPATIGGGGISGSVGKGGKNKPDDVGTVQGLLNRHGASLAVDGDCGPKTKSAISSFQSSKLGSSDGRVDPGGNTWAALNGMAGATALPGSEDPEDGGFFGDLGDMAEDLVDSVSDFVPDSVAEAAETIGDAVDTVTDRVGDAAIGIFGDGLDEDQALEELQRITASFDEVIKELEAI